MNGAGNTMNKILEIYEIISADFAASPGSAVVKATCTRTDRNILVDIPIGMHEVKAGMFLLKESNSSYCVISRAAFSMLFKPEKDPNHIEFPLMKTDKQKRIDELRKGALESRYLVACERDTKNPFESRGSIVMETYLADANLVTAVNGASSWSARGYGKTQIFKLVPVDLDEAKEAIS